MRNYYKVLGVPESATAAEIKQAYRKLAALHHPDHNPHDPLAMLEMKMINEAYNVLSDPAKRVPYDRINNLHGAPVDPQSEGFSGATPGPEQEDIQTTSPALRHNPFSTSDDQTPRHPENITNVLWVMQDQNRNGITPCIRNVLWIDLIVSIVYLIYYFIMRPYLPVMPPGSKQYYYMYRQMTASWMVHFAKAAYLELAASIIAVYWMKRTERSSFLTYYLIIKSYMFTSVAAAFFGLTTIKTSIFISATVSLWKLFLIASLFLSRLEQVIWRVRKNYY